jgi:phenylacetate-CoA ligase
MSQMIRDPSYEMMPRLELEQLQLERLQAMLNRLYSEVSYYRNLLDSVDLPPSEFRSLDCLTRVPFTRKETLRDNYPYGLFAVPLREIVRIQASSGTTGQPVVTGYTRNDIRHWTEVVARAFSATGVSKDDVVQICLDYGLFSGGLAFHYGAEEIGASVIPASTLNPKGQLDIMRHYKTTSLVCVPTYALRLVQVAQETRIPPQELSLRTVLVTGEPWPEATGEKIERGLHVKVFDVYGVSEVMGPGISFECEAGNGLHISEDHFIAEIVDRQTDRVLRDGEEGELVLTTITKEAFPLLRFRTGDLTALDRSPCPCGRSLARMKKVAGRVDNAVFVQGKSIFPSQVEQVLQSVEGVVPRFQIVVNKSGTAEELRLRVEMDSRIFSDEMRVLADLKRRIERKIEEVLGVVATVLLVESRSPGGNETRVEVIRRNKQNPTEGG